jgi:hypothetical protein
MSGKNYKQIGMKTDWQALSKKLGVLKEDGSELYQGFHSAQALEEILGEEWLKQSLKTFIDGTPGNELAIKTLRYISSPKAASMAYQIYTDHKDTDQRQASMAIWALSDIRTEVSLEYVEEMIERPEYEGITISVLRNLIYDHIELFTKEKLETVLNKISDKYQTDIDPLRIFVNQHFVPVGWYTLLDKIQKRPTLYHIQKVEDLFLFYMGYAISLENKSIEDTELKDFETHFTDFVIKDYAAPSHCNWSTAIRLYSTSDLASVELFFEELAKYKTGHSDFDRIMYREENKIFCCQQMYDQIQTNQSHIKYDNSNLLLNKYGSGVYRLENINANDVFLEINHCPWCGTKLKAS